MRFESERSLRTMSSKCLTPLRRCSRKSSRRSREATSQAVDGTERCFNRRRSCMRSWAMSSWRSWRRRWRRVEESDCLSWSTLSLSAWMSRAGAAEGWRCISNRRSTSNVRRPSSTCLALRWASILGNSTAWNSRIRFTSCSKLWRTALCSASLSSCMRTRRMSWWKPTTGSTHSLYGFGFSWSFDWKRGSLGLDAAVWLKPCRWSGGSFIWAWVRG
mmetsp:Transcript_8823/g.17624  ORF Transcript_8823/g.17624 Transcript_8823/m.17624 type:complete len:217 (-) Transcript_8823:515-1165(-)